MSEHLSIGDLERLRAGEETDGARTLEQMRQHLSSCAACQATNAELTSLDSLVSRVREVSRAPGTDPNHALRIDGYELSHEIHRGGQGVVYHATQRSTNRVVAIKVLLKGTLASDGQRMRFDQEIDLASRINHPNVVSIIDRGVTDDGRGFLVMELIEGPTLDGYMNEHMLSITQRLRLFLQICDGVSAAHQRGVMHRDLKPANILIDQADRPRLLDFGLAKEHLDETEAMVRTLEGEFMGTLAYASPEQLRGKPSLVDMRSDIYSLGVLLFEMLTGELPHSMSGSIDSVIQRIVTQTPKGPRTLNPKLDPDLDIVLLHALEHDPGRRYQTVDALANDVRAVLEHRPIDARRASTVYQMRKFARRNKAAVTVSGVVVLGLIGTVTALSLGMIRANAANKLAEQRRVAAEIELDKQSRISTFFRDLLAEVDPGQSGPDMRVMELLDVAAGEMEERFGAYPELRGSIQSTIGETYTRLGSYENAEHQLNDAIHAMRSLEDPPPRALASALVVLAQVQSSTSRFDDAEESLGQAVALINTHEPESGNTEVLAQIDHQRGAMLYERGEFEDSILAYEQALARLGEMDELWSKRIGSQVLTGMGVSLKRLERFDESLNAYDRALVMLAETRDENHPDTLACQSNRVEVLKDLGRKDEAKAQLYDLIERRKTVFGAQHERVGITLNNLADLLSSQGEFIEASELFDQAIAIFRINPGDPSLRLAITIHNAGVMHLDQHMLDQARAQLGEAASMTSEILPEGHWIRAQFRVKLAECMMMQGEPTEARQMLIDARVQLASALGSEHRRVAHVDTLLEQLDDHAGSD